MMFTHRAWILLGLGGLVALLGAARPDLLGLTLLIDLLAILAITVDAFTLPRADAFQVQRKRERVLSLGASNRVELTLRHALRVPHRARLRDEPPPLCDYDPREFTLTLTPNQPAQVAYHLTPHYRGEARFEDVFLRVEGRFGLTARDYRLPAREIAPVYPNLLQMREYDLLRHRGRLRQIGFRQMRMRGQGSEFDTLREYTPDDEFRHIDWKATARRGKPIVRDYRAERSQNVMLLLDAGRNMLAEVDGERKFDTVLNTALMLAYVAIQMDDKVGALAFADEIDLFSPPQRGKAQVAKLVERLHDAQPRMVESDYLYAATYLAKRWHKRSLIVIFTDLIDPDASRILLHAVSTLRKQHLCVAITVADPRLHALSQQTPNAPEDLYRRAVATQTLNDRLAAMRTLEHMGVHCIDAEPDTLVANLVNYYLQVKSRGGL
ncbi:MAG: hypothetical protein KatS3mg017_1020 [Fimbriimonadales bacterium]|nr:MAG: hypothetical protein KatS3mg017_1020 [Fimbriimonadales bacterium]GIV10162.1 MAG: hypothetical protein KatS3mg019_2253 [Fimbriimonadales bacterium]